MKVKTAVISSQGSVLWSSVVVPGQRMKFIFPSQLQDDDGSSLKEICVLSSGKIGSNGTSEQYDKFDTLRHLADRVIRVEEIARFLSKERHVCSCRPRTICVTCQNLAEKLVDVFDGKIT